MDAHGVNLIGALARGLTDLQEKAMAERGLAPADAAALLAVFARPGGTVADVATATGLTHSGAVRAVQRLVGAALVDRREGDDRRMVSLVCTAAGAERSREALTRRRDALRGLMSSLGDREQATLERITAKLLRQLPGDRDGARYLCRLCDHRVCRGDGCPVGSAVA